MQRPFGGSHFMMRLAAVLLCALFMAGAPAHWGWAQGAPVNAPVAADGKKQAPAANGGNEARQPLARQQEKTSPSGKAKTGDKSGNKAKEQEKPPAEPAEVRRDAFAGIKQVAARAGRVIPEVEKLLGEARLKIARPDISQEELGKQRGVLENLRLRVLKARKELEEPLKTVDNQLKALGAPPKDGETEDEGIAAQRKALDELRDRLSATDKKLGLLLLEIGQLSQRAADRQRKKFLSGIFQPSRSLLNPLLWVDGLAVAPDFFLRLRVLLSSWSGGEGKTGISFFIVLGLFLISLGLLFYVWRHWRRPLARDARIDELHRLWRAVRVALFSAVVLLLLLLVSLIAVYMLGGPSPRIERFLEAFSEGLLFSVVAVALARGIFRPTASHMRLVNLGDAAAARAFLLSSATAIVFGLDHLVGRLAEILFLAVDFQVMWSALVSLLYVILIAWLLSAIKQGEPLVAEEGAGTTAAAEDGGRFFFSWTRYVFHLLWLVLLAIVVALVAGYVALAHFIASQTVLTSVLVVGLYLLHHLADAAVRSALDAHTYTGRFLRRTMSLPEGMITQLGVLFSTLVDISIVVIGLPIVLMQWTVDWVDMVNWARSAFFGFKVGNITIEPSSLLLGLLVLVIGLVLARLLTRWLERRVLERTNMDSGVRHSIATTAKYSLTIGAFLVALSVAGVNFASLAFIGGALGIGIGFGMQSIVNNFVSGLILLAERPIKVGDWIKVSGGEGIVRKIKVRSTEIETFDRCSVIVPNSSLISEPVSNWYHSSRMGRLRLPIGVSYDADPDEVEKILLRLAMAHPRALAAPKSFVLFTGFGDNSLDFELRVYIDDAGYLASVASDLRFAIFRAFRQANIEIPFPQRDIHIRDLPADIFDKGGMPPRITPADDGKEA